MDSNNNCYNYHYEGVIITTGDGEGIQSPKRRVFLNKRQDDG
jgi:hypothetical protein